MADWIEIFTRNFWTKVISFLIACVLWVIVLGSRTAEITKDVPIEVVTPTDLVPANDLPEKVSFRLAGPKAFLRTILDRQEEPIRVNLSGANAGLVTYRIFSDNIRVPIGVKVLSMNPTSIVLKLEHIKRRDVPVKLEIRGEPPEGYHITKTEIKPNVVRVRGPESRVDSVTEVATLPVDVSDLRQAMEREVGLDIQRHGIQLDGPLPRVNIELDPSSANFRIKNVDVRVQSAFKATVLEKNITVLVRASSEDLRSLDKTLVYGVVDLKGKPKGKYREKLRVNLPANIGFVKAVPDTVTVTLH